MTTSVESLKEELHETFMFVRDLAAKAECENRQFTDSEKSQVEAGLQKAERLKRQLTDAQVNQGIDELLGFDLDYKSDVDLQGRPQRSPQRSKGGFTNAMKGSWNTSVQAYLDKRGEKALTPAGVTVAPTAWDPKPVGMGQPEEWIADIIRDVRQIDTEEFSFFRQVTRTNNAAPVAKGALKPTSPFELVKVTDKLRTIAHVSETVPRQDLRDATSLAEFLEGEMRLGLRLTIDAQILNGSGVGDNMTGILNTTGIQTQALGTDDRIVATRKAKTLIQKQDSNPSHYVFHPDDWEQIDLMVDNEQRYYQGGPRDISAPKLWGLPVVVTKSIPVGTGLVGDFRDQLRLYFQPDTEISWSENVNDNFARNLFVVRAESRVNHAVLRPLAFASITGI